MEKTKRRKVNLKFAIELLIFTTILAVVTSMAKFRTTSFGNNKAVVAVPILSSTTLELETMYPNMNPIEYDLIVKNTQGTIVSQVVLNYVIDIESVGNVPIKIELYKLNNGVKMGENLLVNGKTFSIEMPISEMIHNYKLIISWNSQIENYDSYKYNGETSFLKINVDAIQKD